MGCDELFLKSVSSTFTGYLVIVSAVFIVFGLSSTYLLLISNSVETLEEEYVSVPSLILALFGILLLIFIIFGCCGLCKEVPCCLEIYSIFLIFLTTAEFLLGAFCLMHFSQNKSDLSERISDEVTQLYSVYPESPRELDNIQQWLRCCGITGPYNWLKDNRTIPGSCCKDWFADCGILSSDKFVDGCSNVVFNFIINVNFIIGWVCIVVALTQFIAAMMALSLSCAYWRTRRVLWI